MNTSSHHHFMSGPFTLSVSVFVLGFFMSVFGSVRQIKLAYASDFERTKM